MLRVSDKIIIEEWELSEQFMRASGPGGQNVNKVSSAVELRFAAARSAVATATAVHLDNSTWGRAAASFDVGLGSKNSQQT